MWHVEVPHVEASGRDLDAEWGIAPDALESGRRCVGVSLAAAETKRARDELLTGCVTPGARLRAALNEERPLQIVGAINAYAALLAQRCGFRALYLSGSGVAGVSLGLPDLGITNLADIYEDARRITYATDLPLLVDADAGFGTALGVARAVRYVEAGADMIFAEALTTLDACRAEGDGDCFNRIGLPPPRGPFVQFLFWTQLLDSAHLLDDG